MGVYPAGCMAIKSGNNSRKGAKHVLSEAEGAAKEEMKL